MWYLSSCKFGQFSSNSGKTNIHRRFVKCKILQSTIFFEDTPSCISFQKLFIAMIPCGILSTFMGQDIWKNCKISTYNFSTNNSSTKCQNTKQMFLCLKRHEISPLTSTVRRYLIFRLFDAFLFTKVTWPSFVFSWTLVWVPDFRWDARHDSCSIHELWIHYVGSI